MSSIARIVSIACLLIPALAEYQYCNYNDTLTLNLTWDLMPCQRGDGVWAYTDDAGGCCATLDIDTCTAHPSCLFYTVQNVCGLCMSVDFVNSEFNLTGTNCEETSAEFEATNPLIGAFADFLCEPSVEIDCCSADNLPDEPDFNTTNNCTTYDAETCVADGADSDCALLYIVSTDCYTCTYAGGWTCAYFQTFAGIGGLDNNTAVYCDSSQVGDALSCTAANCFSSSVCGMQLNACFNSTDCAYVIFNIEDTGDYQEMANAALDLCTQDGYSCSDELDELTSCMLSSPNCGASTTTTSTSTTSTTTTTTTSAMDTTEMMSTEMTDEPATSEGDDGTSAAARVYQVMAMLITFGMMMIAF